MSWKAVRWESRRQASSRCSQRPQVLVADDVFPRFVYAVVTLKTAAMDTRNSVTVLVTDDPAKRAPKICPLWKSDKSSILPHFYKNCY